MTQADEFLESCGITLTDREFFLMRAKPIAEVVQELACLTNEQRYPQTVSPALLNNGLIKRLTAAELSALENQFSSAWIRSRSFELFIPAAGAATRQLLLLRTILHHPRLSGLDTPEQLIAGAQEGVGYLKAQLDLQSTQDKFRRPEHSITCDSIKADLKVLQEVIDYTGRLWQEGIVEGRFAFLVNIDQTLHPALQFNLPDAINRRNLRKIAEFIVSPEGLNYGSLPKLLMRIHSYKSGEGVVDARLALEEHVREAAALLKGSKKLRLHFPISREHQEAVNLALEQIFQKEDLVFFLKEQGLDRHDIQITFSYQDQATDSVSLLSSTKKLARDSNGQPLLRKAGHGALIGNLSRLTSDSIWINNVDNVLYDNPHIKRIVILFKRAMASLGVALEKRVHEFIRGLQDLRLEVESLHPRAMNCELKAKIADIGVTILDFLRSDLQMQIKLDLLSNLPYEQQIISLIEILQRPIVVAGFVPLEQGQAGGGPFALEVQLSKGILATKVNIVEQSEFKDGSKDAKFRSGEFFNPVMLFIARKAVDGTVYPLDNLEDPVRFFRSEKTDSKGQVLLAYERPGLWNGGIVKAFQVNIALPSCVFGAIKDLAGKESLLAKLHQPYSGPAICELDELRNVVDEETRRFLDPCI